MKCDNCGKTVDKVVRHKIDLATVHDCLDCWTKTRQVAPIVAGASILSASGYAYEKATHCTVCNQQAKYEDKPRGGSPGNVLRMCFWPDLRGWMAIAFPYTPDEGTSLELEHVCPDCAVKVKGILNHLKTPYSDGCDD